MKCQKAVPITTKKKACPTSKTIDEVLGEVRQCEDSLYVMIQRMEGGSLSHQSTIYGLKEIWLKLKKMNFINDGEPEPKT